jgi:hypothetical protein
MILVDTSVWIDHFRRRDLRLEDMLRTKIIVTHEFVIGEIALGRFLARRNVLLAMQLLPIAATVSGPDVLSFVETHNVAGTGIGYVDVHLLASVSLDRRMRLWTRDRRLEVAASSIGLITVT